MAIAYNSVQAGADLGNNSGTGTFSASYTSGSGSNRLLIAAIWGDTNVGADDITGVTYNSATMSLVGKASSAFPDPSRWCYLYYLVNPSSGSNTLQITSTTNHYLGAVCANYTGVKQSGQPSGTPTTNTATGAGSITGTMTPADDNCWTVMCATEAYSDGGYGTAGAATTLRVFDATFGQIGILDSNAAITPAASTSLIYVSHASNPRAVVIGAFAPDTGGGGGAFASRYYYSTPGVNNV